MSPKKRKRCASYTKGQLNKVIDDLIHPHYEQNEGLRFLDALLHGLVEQNPLESLEKSIRYNLPEIIKKIRRKQRKKELSRNVEGEFGVREELNRVSRDIERRVFDLHFRGVPRDAIAHQLGISPATVSEILSVLPSQLDALRVLSVELRKNNMIPAEALLGIRIMKDLVALGSEPKQFSSSLEAVIKMSADAKYRPECVVQAATRLVELENEAGKDYPEALKEFEAVTERTSQERQQGKKLKTRNSQLQAQIRDNEGRLAQVFKASDEAPQDISEYKKVKAKLREHGLSLNDVDVVTKLLDNVREVCGDVNMLVSLVKKVGSLIREKADLKNDTKRISSEQAYIRNQNEIEGANLRLKRNLNLELERKIQANQWTLSSQASQIQINYDQLCRISFYYQRIDQLLKEAIGEIGRIIGMDDQKIEWLQLEADFEIVYRELQKRFKAFLKQRQEEFLER
jgi:hypothetical protein